MSSPEETAASLFDVFIQDVSFICLVLLRTLETSEKKLDIYLPLNASTCIGASRHNKLIIRLTNFSGLFTYTWNATDKGKPKYLDKNLSSGQSGIETGFYPQYSPILPRHYHSTNAPLSHSIVAAPTLYFLPMTASLTRHFCPPSYEGLCDRHDSYIADLSVSLMVQSFRLQEFSSATLTSSAILTLFGYPDFSSATMTLFGYPESLWLP